MAPEHWEDEAEEEKRFQARDSSRGMHVLKASTLLAWRQVSKQPAPRAGRARVLKASTLPGVAYPSNQCLVTEVRSPELLALTGN
ncbi:hypothetical protein NDU88_010267 [Pleurodeles waltl]|uniref:Uncharacterized protein n=1 Tax=Pleurodeles waltl TaxID=8319 RepID=A0AAV7QXR9_PLEWA|nr:hypothetical protein NDU88_010267 [Pleurodeles waltl]